MVLHTNLRSPSSALHYVFIYTLPYFTDLQEGYGSSLRFLRHGHLHTGLLNNLEATEGHPVKLHLKTNVADLDCEEGIIRTSDDAEVEKDTNLLVNGLGVRALA